MLKQITIKYWRIGITGILFIFINIFPYITENDYFIKNYNNISNSTWFYRTLYEKKSLEKRKVNKLKKENLLVEDSKSSFLTQKKMFNDFVKYNSTKQKDYKQDYKIREEKYLKTQKEYAQRLLEVKRIENIEIKKVDISQIRYLKADVMSKKTTNDLYKLKKSIRNRKSYYFFSSFISVLALVKLKKKDTHGSAEFAKYEDLGQRKGEQKDIDLLGHHGVTLGRYGRITLYDNSDTHIMLIAPTRSGKGIGFIIPTLIHSWIESVITLDIKGENQVLTSNARRAMGNKVITMFFNDRRSIKYNPLEAIKLNSDDEVANAKSIAEIIINTSPSSNDSDFWTSSAVDILSGIIIYSLYTIPKKENRSANLYDVAQFLLNLDVQNMCKQLVNVPILNQLEAYNIKNYYPTQRDSESITKGIHPFANNTLIRIASEAEKTWAGFSATMKTKLSVFDMPKVVENTSESEFDIADIANYKKPVSLYLRVNAKEVDILKPLINIFLSQVVNELMSNREFELDVFKNTHRTLFMLDEFPNFGRLKTIDKTITYAGGYKMKFVIIAQEFNQLYNIYTDKNSLFGNSQCKVFYTPNHIKDATEISDILGSKTITIRTRSGSMAKSNVNVSQTSRKLMNPDEILQYKSTKSLIKAGNKPIVRADKIEYYKEKFYMDRIKPDNNVMQDEL